MTILTALISPVSGAIIGYFTNWLAIKMLFRPYTEKRIFNIKVPFTPGLIPKERYHLSAKIGETIGTHLITAEVLTKEITSDGVSDRIKDILDGFFDELIEKNLTVADILEKVAGEERDQLVGKCVNYVHETAAGHLKDTSVPEFIANVLVDKFIELLKDEEVFNRASTFLESVRDIAVDKGKEFFTGEEFKSLINKSIDGLYKYSDKKLDEIIPENVVCALKNVINDNLPKASEMIKKILEEQPAIDESLSKTVAKIIDENFGKLIGIFINHEKIYSNIKAGIFNYLDDDFNRNIIYIKLEEALMKFLSNEVGVLLNKIPDKELLADRAVDILIHALADKLVDNMLNFSISKVNELNGQMLYDMLEKFKPGFEERMRISAVSKISSYLDEQADAIIIPVISKVKNWLLGVSVNSLILRIGGGSAEKTKALALSLIKMALEKCSAYVAESLDVPKMVEDKMNAFDVAEAESIIVSVVSRELKAITAVGGILGFIIGLLPLIFNSLQ